LVLEAVGLYPCSYVDPVVIMPHGYPYPIVMGLDVC
jgi:hypothetical protein